MKISGPHKDVSTVPRMSGNKLLAGSGRHKIGRQTGEKREKDPIFSLFFITTLQRNYIKPFPPSSVTNMGQRPQKSNLSEKYFPSEIITSITELWQAGEIWRNIKKDVRITILVSKLATAWQSHEVAKFNANMTCKVSWAKLSVTLWARSVMSSLFILLVGHNYRAAFDVNLCRRKLWKILGGKEMEVGMGRKKQVEDW